MTLRTLTPLAALGAALVLGVPTAWGADEPLRDHGDAAQAKLDTQSSAPLVIVRDHGDASQAKVEQSQPETSVVILRDHGDATQAQLANQSAASYITERIRLAHERPLTPVASRIVVSNVDSGRAIEWPQVGAGLGIGLLLALGLGLMLRALKVRPFAH